MSDATLIALGRTCWGTLEPLHVIGYFAPEPAEAYVALGLHRRLAYFAARSAAMGPVAPELTTATFYVFAPDLVARALPSAWSIATPAAIQHARRRGVAAALHGILGEPEVREAADLAREATRGLTTAGRPLYAAHRTLDWPTDPLLALWHAATLLREHRGDGHVAALSLAGLDPVEALVTSGLHSDNTEFVRTTRGWTDAEWQAGQERLRDRGLLTSEGELSSAGRELRDQVEADTDRLAGVGFAHLGADGTRRLTDLVAPLRNAVLASGVLPGWISGRGR